MKRALLLAVRYAMLAIAATAYWTVRFLAVRARIDRQTKRKVWWQIRGRIYSITEVS